MHKIETRLTREEGSSDVLNFEVQCKEYGEHVDDGVVRAFLRGFVIYTGMLPDKFDEGLFDQFDARSNHTADAYNVLLNYGARIRSRIGEEADFVSSLVTMDRGWVAPGLRGKGLMLRLMREARHVLFSRESLVLMKAHPDRPGADVDG